MSVFYTNKADTGEMISGRCKIFLVWIFVARKTILWKVY